MERGRNTGKEVSQLARTNAARIEKAYPNTRPGVIVVNHGNGTFTVNIPGEGVILKVPAQYPRALKGSQPGDPVIVGYLWRKRRVRFILSSYPGTVSSEEELGSMKKTYRPEFGWFAQHFNGGRGRSQNFTFNDPDEAYAERACAQVPLPWELDPEWPVTRWLPGNTLPLTWKFIPLLVDERETIEQLDEDGNPETIPNPAFEPILDRIIIPNGGADSYSLDLRDGLFTELWDGAAIATDLGEIGRGMLYQESGIIDLRTGLQVATKAVGPGTVFDVHLSYSSTDPPTVAKPVMVENWNVGGIAVPTPEQEQWIAKLFDMESMAPHVDINLTERFGDVRGVRYFTMDGGSIMALFTRYNGTRTVPHPNGGTANFASDADLVLATFWSVTGETLLEEVIEKSVYGADGTLIPSNVGNSVGLGNGAFATVYYTSDSPQYVRIGAQWKLQYTRRQWLTIGGQSGVTVRRELANKTAIWDTIVDGRFNVYNPSNLEQGSTALNGHPIFCRDYPLVSETLRSNIRQPYMAMLDPSTGEEIWRDTSYVVTTANDVETVKYMGGSSGRQPGVGGYQIPRGVVFRRRENQQIPPSVDPDTTHFNDMAIIGIEGVTSGWTDITPWYGPQATQLGARGTPCVVHDEHIYISKRHNNGLYPGWAVPGVANNTAELFRLRQPGPPRIFSVYPAIGPAAGGTSVVIRGKRFTGATSVKFGGVEATSFVFVSSVKLTAVSPPVLVGGIVQVTVTAAAGVSVDAAQFEYEDPPEP